MAEISSDGNSSLLLLIDDLVAYLAYIKIIDFLSLLGGHVD